MRFFFYIVSVWFSLVQPAMLYAQAAIAGTQSATQGNAQVGTAAVSTKEAESKKSSCGANAWCYIQVGMIGASVAGMGATAYQLFQSDKELGGSAATDLDRAIGAQLTNDYNNRKNNLTKLIPNTPVGTGTDGNLSDAVDKALANKTDGTYSDKTGNGSGSLKDLSLGDLSLSQLKDLQDLALSSQYLSEAVGKKDFAGIASNPLFQNMLNNAAKNVSKQNGMSVDSILKKINADFAGASGGGYGDGLYKKNANDEDKKDKKNSKDIMMSQSHDRQGRNIDIFYIIRDRYMNRYYAGLFLDKDTYVESNIETVRDVKKVPSKTVVSAPVIKYVEPVRRIPTSNAPVLYKNKNTEEVSKW